MKLLKSEKTALKDPEVRIAQEETVQEILRILNDVKSSFTIARYFLALNQRPETVSAYVANGCEKFEVAKKLLESVNGLKQVKGFIGRFEVIEEDISCLKKILEE
jgi:hypothetical protein